jgi:hypothetical protein
VPLLRWPCTSGSLGLLLTLVRRGFPDAGPNTIDRPLDLATCLVEGLLDGPPKVLAVLAHVANKGGALDVFDGPALRSGLGGLLCVEAEVGQVVVDAFGAVLHTPLHTFRRGLDAVLQSASAPDECAVLVINKLANGGPSLGDPAWSVVHGPVDLLPSVADKVANRAA